MDDTYRVAKSRPSRLAAFSRPARVNRTSNKPMQRSCKSSKRTTYNCVMVSTMRDPRDPPQRPPRSGLAARVWGNRDQKAASFERTPRGPHPVMARPCQSLNVFYQ
jgi:hypothetical protein